MNEKYFPIEISRSSSSYQIDIGDGLLKEVGSWAARCLKKNRGRLVVVSNKKVFSVYGDFVIESLSAAGFEVFVHLIGDGERYKNLRTLEQTVRALSLNRLTRTDAVIALGGGVVGDLAGFAASVYLRGIDFLQIPTSLLAMIDSSVGGKTAVNTEFGKNLLGAFYQPRGVLIDVRTLVTLPKREMTAGFCEAVKQAAIGGHSLLKTTGDTLKAYQPEKFSRQLDDENLSAALVEMIYAQVAFKAEIVKGDEKEDPANVGSRSRKILNFGHTLAHALEKTTNYKYLKHGEAVGYGILMAVELSKMLELLPQTDVELLNDVVGRVGKLPPIRHLATQPVIESFQFDKKIVNTTLQWVLLKGIGKPVIISHKEIPPSTISAAINKIFG